MVAQRLALVLIALYVNIERERPQLSACGWIDINNLVEALTVNQLRGVIGKDGALLGFGILATFLQFYPHVVGGAFARLGNLVDKLGLHLVTSIVAVHVAHNNNRTRIQVCQHIVTQLAPLRQTRIAVKAVPALHGVAPVAGIHVHIVDDDTCTAGQRQLTTTEALSDQLVERMAELSEGLLPRHTLRGRFHNISLPASPQAVTRELYVLGVQEIDLIVRHVNADSAAPLVDVIVVLQPGHHHLMIIKVLLKASYIKAVLGNILTNTRGAGFARTIGIHIKNKNLLRQPVDIHRSHLQLFCLLGKAAQRKKPTRQQQKNNILFHQSN